MGWFRKSASRDPLAVTMAGVKLGDRFLSVGVRDVPLVAALATRAGLTGRACAIEADAARAREAAAALERDGALVEVVDAPWDALPYEPASFDVALARDLFSTLAPDRRAACAAGILRVLRGGGRILVVEGTRRARVEAGALTAPLQSAGFAAARVLAEAEHMIFVEGIKRA